MAAEKDIAEFKATELLKEVKIDYSKTGVLDDTIDVIREFLLNLHDEEVKGTLLSLFIRDLGVPEDKANFIFRKPESAKVIGSYALKAIAKPCLKVDLAVQMPQACFFEKDFLNHRYHAKRALYLAVLKRHLMSCSAVKEVRWSTFRDEARKPILVLHLGQEGVVGNDRFVIQLIPTLPSCVFDLSKLSPTRNNVRKFIKEGITHPTPYYNSTILEDMFIETHDSFIQSQLSGSKSLLEGLLLLKVWLRQRSSINTPDCLNGFMISIILSYLSTGEGEKRFKSQMTKVQIFRCVMDFLATSNLLVKGIFMHLNSTIKPLAEFKKALHQSFDVVICESSGCFNMAFRMSKNGFSEFREEARNSFQNMIKYKDIGFDKLFMTKVDCSAKFDYYARIKPGKHDPSGLQNICLDKEQWRVYEKELESTILKGLGERAHLVRVLPRSIPETWAVEKGLVPLKQLQIHVGILISDFEKGFRKIDVGPSIENKDETLAFRKFWGEQSELRRFKDGVTAECTVWECQPWEKHRIIKKIVEFVLGHHLVLSSHEIRLVADQLDFTLMQEDKDPIASTPELLIAFDALSKQLRSLKGLPLEISSVQPLHSALRQTSVFPPKSHPLAREIEHWPRDETLSTCLQPLEVMIQLEGSGNWPVGDIAIEKTKSAFCLIIADSLQKQFGVTHVVAEDAVDLLTSGFAFRLRICYEKDKSLLRREAPICSVLTLNEQHKSNIPFEKDFLLRSQHASMINGLQGVYPVYGPTVRLAKRWSDSHMFSGIIVEEAIELLVAYLFVKPFPFHAPLSRITGFLRFLRLIAEFEWSLFPLIVDINGDLTVEEQTKIVSQFDAKRKGSFAESAMSAMYIATAYDKESESWTSSSPDCMALTRLIAYARSSADLLTRLVSGEAVSGWESLFYTPLQCYDALIFLHKDKLAFPNQVLFDIEFKQDAELISSWRASNEYSPYVNHTIIQKQIDEAKRQLLVGFDPLSYYIEDLKASEISKFFKIWYNTFGSGFIGLTWTKQSASAKKHNKNNKRKRDQPEQPLFDTKRVLKEVGDIGRGLVKSVYLLKSPSFNKALAG